MADWNKLAKYMPTGVFLTFQSLVTLTTHKPDAKPDALGCAAAAALLHCHAVVPFLPVLARASHTHSSCRFGLAHATHALTLPAFSWHARQLEID